MDAKSKAFDAALRESINLALTAMIEASETQTLNREQVS